MKETYVLIVFLVLVLEVVYSVKISFISWNVNDNLKFKEYNKEVISSLLRLKTVEAKDLPDIYAISFQENCYNCKESNLNKIATPFIETLQSLKSTKYKFVSTYATRLSGVCEKMFCLSKGSFHGTTLIMIIAKETVQVSNIFVENQSGCTHALVKNEEKGIAVVGFVVSNTRYCFGGLHLDVSSISSREECVAGILKKIKSKCDVIFFGGDFNSRPKSKDTPKPISYEGGYDKALFEEMRKTDDFSGTNPYLGGVNLMTSIFQKTGMKFIEPFDKSPNFIPTYSIDSSLRCKFSPICFKPTKYPAWTDRIIFTPANRIQCTEYSSIESLADRSDHLPIFADCVIK